MWFELFSRWRKINGEKNQEHFHFKVFYYKLRFFLILFDCNILVKILKQQEMASASKKQKNINNPGQTNIQAAEKNAATHLTNNNLFTKTQAPQVESVVKDSSNLFALKNLTVVRQASLSSEEGKQQKNAKRQHQKIKKQPQRAPTKYEQKQQSKPKDIEKQKPQVVYDEYNVLKISGLLDAYEHFLKLLCKNGLPTGRVYDYAAQQILKYEKKKINKQLKMRAELDIQKISKKNDKASSNQKSRSVSPYYKQ